MDAFLKTQIITYMGNKRKLLPHIEDIIVKIEKKLEKKLKIGDGFSGSGIVSRLFKLYAQELYVNDISHYSHTLNTCYLSNRPYELNEELKKYVDMANRYVEQDNKEVPNFIQKHWSPNNTNITENDRVYFTHQNGKRIDSYRYFIETHVPDHIKPFLLAYLLVECSIHNNTNGQFSAFYKNGDVGQYGGKKNIDLTRITQPIKLSNPVSYNSTCNTHISCQDTNEWIKKIPELDLVYYDPPYNKHPYNIYYFLLEIIDKWNIHQEIPDTYRGQPLGWERSMYNSSKYAEKAFDSLIKETKAKFILISYNNGGIIPISKIDDILSNYGNVEKIPIEHKTYNRLKGISEYKRSSEKGKIQEYMWLVDTTSKI